jgi:hypothetical protein
MAMPTKVYAMPHAFHKFWLKISAIVIGIGGPIFAFGSMPETAEPARLILDILSWPVDGAQTYAHPDTRFLSALTGGFLMGWGVMVWCLQAWVYDFAPDSVRKTVLAGAMAWFLTDSAGSIASGNASNAAFNVIVLLLVVGPMWRPAKN